MRYNAQQDTPHPEYDMLTPSKTEKSTLQNLASNRARVSKSKIGSWFLVLGLLLLGLGGAFPPWVWRESVALQLTGPGLAEFVKFLPEIRNGQILIERLYFLYPLFVAMLGLPLLVVNQSIAIPNKLGWLLRLAVIPLALASLSPVWSPPILRAEEFRLQTILAALAIGLTLIAPLFKKVPLKPLLILICGAGIVALILSGRQFGLIQASIAEVYHEPISLGWGWWLAAIGVVMTIMGGIWTAFRS